MLDGAAARAHEGLLLREARRWQSPGVRRLLGLMSMILVIFVVLVVSAAACEGPGGPPASPTEEELDGDGSNPGSTSTTQQCGSKVVDCASGNETTMETDTAIGGRGLGLNIVRSYDALASAKAQAESKGVGLWGWGWTGPYEVKLAFATEGSHETATVQQQNGSAITFYKNELGEYEQGGWVQARLIKEGSDYIYTLPDQTKLEFNSEGHLVKETERNGNTTTLTYNGSKQLEKVTDATGRTLTFKYNGEGLVESIKDPMGHIGQLHLHSKRWPRHVSIEGKVRWEFGYTATAPYLLSSVTDGRGHATTIEYDGSHRVIKETIAGHERKWSYGTNETTITEPNGAETVRHFQQRRRAYQDHRSQRHRLRKGHRIRIQRDHIRADAADRPEQTHHRIRL